MNRVVDRLLEVDRQARQLLDEAQQYYDKTMREIEEEKERLRTHYREGAAIRIQHVEQSESQYVDEAVSAATSECDRLTRQMEAVYARRHQEWEEELFRRCTESFGAKGVSGK